MNLEIQAPIYSVSQINQEIRQLLEGQIAPLWISGEISNFVCASSGHWYFKLKDPKAVLSCAFFQNRRINDVNMTAKNGMKILAHGCLSLYEPRGEYQFIIDKIELAGMGLLQEAFNQLKEKLLLEGLFDPKHKKSLPSFPKTIGMIASPAGAVIHDVLQVLSKRLKMINVILYPAAVQGAQAEVEIVEAIKTANQRKECDVLILGRGGGSLEDLWAFNQESVARAIFESDLPIISAIGHEIDFTIADFVADMRAPTPSAAAALASPDCQELSQKVFYFYRRLLLCHPENQIKKNRQEIDRLEQDLFQAFCTLIAQKQQMLTITARSLQTVSPLATLERGYAVLYHINSNKLITCVSQIKLDEKIKAKLKDGEIFCRVEQISKKNY